MNLPAEALEMEAPIRLNRVALRADSGGAGEWRGGPGLVREYEVLAGPGAGDVSFSHRGERHFSAAAGLHGGGDGARARSSIRRADGREETIPSKIATVLHPGDRVTVETAGGGGYGEPGVPHGARRRRHRRWEGGPAGLAKKNATRRKPGPIWSEAFRDI